MNASDDADRNEIAKRAYKKLYTITPWSEGENAEQNITSDVRGGIYLDGIYNGFLLYAHALKAALETNVTSNFEGYEIFNRMLGTTFASKTEKFFNIMYDVVLNIFR